MLLANDSLRLLVLVLVIGLVRVRYAVVIASTVDTKPVARVEMHDLFVINLYVLSLFLLSYHNQSVEISFIITSNQSVMR